MNVSAPFIRRPIGTALLAIGLFLVGAVAYRFLPVASVPAVDQPTIRVSASQPGGDPQTIAATLAAPLERRLGQIAGVTEMTSLSVFGSTYIVVQFDLNRNIDGAARDVQAALNAAMTDLPTDLPSPPSFRKVNPAAWPFILALTSKTIAPSAIYDVADTVVAQRILQISGVADVNVSGVAQPAIRIQVDPVRAAATGIALDDVRTAIVTTNAQGPLGEFDGGARGETIATNDQLRTVDDYRNVVVKAVNGNVVLLRDIATIVQGTRNSRSAAWFNQQPAVLLTIATQANANVVNVVDRIRELLPELRRWIPAGVEISILSDRTATIRASVRDMQATLAATVFLVMLVVFVFLRRAAPTIAAGVAVPLSLAGTLAAMWLAGFSLDNLSLMALAVSVSFVVDDAVVMMENTFRNMEKGQSPLRATLKGARQIGFTVLSISISLLAAFIPLLFTGGTIGRFFREFSATLAFAIVISTVVSLTVTPMICAHFIHAIPSDDKSRFDRLIEGILGRLLRAYGSTLAIALRHQAIMLIIMVVTIALTVDLYYQIPKSSLPLDDSGLVSGSTRVTRDTSFKTMVDLQRQVADIVAQDPAVANVSSSIYNWPGDGRLIFSLKPLAQRDGLSTQRVIDRLRRKTAHLAGVEVSMYPIQELHTGTDNTGSQYQFTLWSPDLDELNKWIPRVLDRITQISGTVGVWDDRGLGGLQLDVSVDRTRASLLGVKMQTINASLNDAFAQRQISTIYSQRNQYGVILEIDPQFQRDPNNLNTIYVPGLGGAQVPLSAVAKFDKGLAPIVVNHRGQFPSATISFALRPDANLDAVTDEMARAIAEMHLPDTIHADFAGDARAFTGNARLQVLLIVAALLAIYLVLGVLYESLAHPLTILSTLPAAGLGALLTLQLSRMELSLIAFIGIILLIGIVKKNGIMLVDFALEGERQRGLSPEQAIYEACLVRFRPILMTTLAALFGAVPFVIAIGPGSELRRPLGITIIGGLVVSQFLTIYTTPVVYLLLDRLHRKLWGAARVPGFIAPAALEPAE